VVDFRRYNGFSFEAFFSSSSLASMTKLPPEPADDKSGAPSGFSPEQIDEKLDQLWPKNVRAAAQSSLPLGQRVAHFNIRALLGQGAFGVVYLADDTIENRPVALKLPRVEVLCNPERRKRFSAEAELAIQFDHPGIVKVYQCETEGPTPFIASSWCDGGDLGNWRAQQTAHGADLPPWEDVVEIMAVVADAVDYAHRQGVTHRDLKPANILLCRRLDQASEGKSGLAGFHPKVTDFGLAKLSDPSIEDASASLLVGTPIYMAPELLNRTNDICDDPALADVYSLGAILFEMLAGASPIQGETYFEVLSNIRNEPSLRLSHFRKDLPVELTVICAACLHKNPAARYESAARLAEDLRRCLSGKPVAGKAINVAARGKFWFGRKDWYSIAGWFAIGSQSLVTTWLVLSDFFKVVFGVLTMQEYLTILPQLIFIAVATSFSMILLGIFTLSRKRWAAWGGVALAAFNLLAPISALLSQPLIFNEVYNANDPYFSFKIHLILLLCFLSQLVLFLCAAWPAKRTRI
jgi:serine/threonine protein kinase